MGLSVGYVIMPTYPLAGEFSFQPMEESKPLGDTADPGSYPLSPGYWIDLVT